jgi:uroporphyrin-3 C-methyltransferase
MTEKKSDTETSEAEAEAEAELQGASADDTSADATSADDESAEESTVPVSEQPSVDNESAQQTQPSAPPLDDEHDVFDLPAPTKPKGRVLAASAFLFALAGLGGVGWLYYTLVYLDPLQQVIGQSATLRADNSAFREEFNSRLNELQSEAQTLAETTTANVTAIVADREQAVLKSLNEAISQAPPSAREWKLAEAEYLMRIANHRVLMEDDSAGAMRLLQSADAILAELDDFALHEVRARMADEILGLQQVRRDDLQGLYLRLEAVKSQIDELPVASPEYLQRTERTSSEKTVWQILAEEFGELVRIRSTAESVEPLLAPDEQRYLELNLRLSLEQAQLATLKRHQGVYEHSLSRVREWLPTYSDPKDERARAVLDSLDELLEVDLSRALPDISGSLRALTALRRDDA